MEGFFLACLTCPVLTFFFLSGSHLGASCGRIPQPAATFHDVVFDEEAVEVLLASSTVSFMDDDYHGEVPGRLYLYFGKVSVGDCDLLLM